MKRKNNRQTLETVLNPEINEELYNDDNFAQILNYYFYAEEPVEDVKQRIEIDNLLLNEMEKYNG